jgi:hypothetical protein
MTLFILCFLMRVELKNTALSSGQMYRVTRGSVFVPKLYVTCTIGYASLTQEENAYDWLARAIIGMLDGKQNGGNTIQIGPQFSGRKFGEVRGRDIPPPSMCPRRVVHSSETPDEWRQVTDTNRSSIKRWVYSKDSSPPPPVIPPPVRPPLVTPPPPSVPQHAARQTREHEEEREKFSLRSFFS